jgi:hypothetical protein
VKFLGRTMIILLVSAAVACCFYLLVRSTGGGDDRASGSAEFGRRDLRGRSYPDFALDRTLQEDMEMRRGRRGEFSEYGHGHGDEASVGRGLAGMTGNLILIGCITFAVARINSAVAHRSNNRRPAGTNVS